MGLNIGLHYIKQIEVPETASCQSDKMTYKQEKHWFKLGKCFAEKSMRDDLKAEYDRGWDDGHKSTYTGTQPHKCPVCEGRCRVKAEMYTIPTVNSPIFLQCNSCNGTGIVWG
jgi:DnaJ-class molecular chaperone